MVSLEHQDKTPFNPTPDSQEDNPLQSLSALFCRLSPKLSLEGSGKRFTAVVNKNIFKENNIDNAICKVFFNNKAEGDFAIMITQSILIIEAFSVEKKLKSKKASLILYADGNFLQGILYIVENKHENNTGLRPRNTDIKFDDCSGIIKTVEAIAAGKGLIKQ